MSTDYSRKLTTLWRAERAPKFAAWVKALTEPAATCSDILTALGGEAYALDTARGKQLDMLAEWIIGPSARVAELPVTGVFFSWSDDNDIRPGDEAVGWNRGRWFVLGDEDGYLVRLADDELGTLMRLRIAANHWDGTLGGWQEAYTNALAGQAHVSIMDNRDMTVTVQIHNVSLTEAQLAVIRSGAYIEPIGVAVIYQEI